MRVHNVVRLEVEIARLRSAALIDETGAPRELELPADMRAGSKTSVAT